MCTRELCVIFEIKEISHISEVKNMTFLSDARQNVFLLLRKGDFTIPHYATNDNKGMR